MPKRLPNIIYPVVFFLALIFLGAKLLNDPTLPEKVAGWGVLAPIGLIFLKASTIIVAPLGGNPIYLAAPKFFGLKMAMVYLIAGDLIGYIGAFLLARKFGDRILKRFLTDEQHSEAHRFLGNISTWKKFFVARLVLSALSDILSYAAGLTKLPLWQFSWITLINVVAYVVVITLLGNAFVTNSVSFILVTIGIAAAPFVFSKIYRKLKPKAK